MIQSASMCSLDVLPNGDPERKNEEGVVAVHVNPKYPQNIIFQGAGRHHW